MSFFLEDDFESLDHQMAPGQKLNMDEIRRFAPDSIEIIHIKGGLGPQPEYSVYLLKNKTATSFTETEVEQHIQENDFALLKQEFKVLEWTLFGTPVSTQIPEQNDQ